MTMNRMMRTRLWIALLLTFANCIIVESQDTDISIQQVTANCDFDEDSSGKINPCFYIINPKGLSLNPWYLGRGSEANWKGGATSDASTNGDGGYAFASMSELQGTKVNDSAFMVQTPHPPTGSQGKCITFKYQMTGLSAKILRVLIFSYSDDSLSGDDISGIVTTPTDPSESSNQNSETEPTSTAVFLDPSSVVQEPIKYDVSKIWEQRDGTSDGVWIEGKVSYSSASHHSIVFEATADVKYSSHRGFIAIDNILVTDGPCGNDCLFDVGFCAWSNDETDDDFDWKLGRSTSKRGTGPARDQSSSINPKLKTGGYAYIDSSFPLKPFNRARLVSSELTGEEEPLCLTFWAHMYGGGIGNLRVLMQIGSEDPEELWLQNGANSLDRWNPSQLTLAAGEGTTYKVIIEAEVGIPGKGDIAIDTLLIKPGACPQLPHGSGVGTSSADCSFMVNTCQWLLIQPLTLTISFTPMLIQSSGSFSTPLGHTEIQFMGVDYYMEYDLGNYKHRLRDSAQLVSPTIQNKGQGICLSFWVYMFTNVPTETTIGALSVIVSTDESNTTVWKLQNQQLTKWKESRVFITEVNPFKIYLKGTKGTKKNGIIGVDDITVYRSSCSFLPAEAVVAKQDCSFDENMCLWKIENPIDGTNPSMKDIWRYSSASSSVTVVSDHTFGYDKAGFIFIEALNADIRSLFVSPEMSGTGNVCVTFYFASFFSDGTAFLTVKRRDSTGATTIEWQATQADLAPRPYGNAEVEWNYGQVGMAKDGAKIIFEGKVRSGGWAIDDIKLYDGSCQARPSGAVISDENGGTNFNTEEGIATNNGQGEGSNSGGGIETPNASGGEPDTNVETPNTEGGEPGTNVETPNTEGGEPGATNEGGDTADTTEVA